MKKSFLSILTAAFLFLGFVLPVHAATDVTVSLATDAENYKQSDTISVTGTVLKGTSAGKGTSPTLQVKNSSGKTVETYQWQDTQIGASGSISTTIKPKKYVDGTYTVHLSAKGAKEATKTIVISGEEVKKTSITVLTDNTEYTQGETVLISGVVLPANEKVILSVEKDGKKLVSNKEVTASTNGSYSDSFNTKDAAIGSYKVSVHLNSSPTITAEKTVKVNAKTDPTSPDPGTTPPTTPDPGTTPKPDPTPTPPPGDIIPKPPVNPTPVPDPTVKPYAPKVNMVTSVSTVITGTADVGTTVIISDREKFRVWSDANSSGVFSITLSEKLKAGTKLYATAKAGEIESDVTELVVVEVTPPAAPSVETVSDKDTVVRGSSEVGSTITIKVGNKMLETGTAPNGLFNIKIKSQKAGTVLSITAKDQDGNISSTKYITVLDKTAPKAPSVSKVSDKTTRVIGTSEAGAKITIKSGKKLLSSGTADKKGKFSIKIKLQKAGTLLAVTAADKAGNISKIKTVTVLDKTAPKIPTVNAVKKTATKVTGKAEAGAKVYVKAGKKVIGSATVSKKGTYSVKIKKQKTGTNLAVYAKDKAGNTGKTKTVTVKK